MQPLLAPCFKNDPPALTPLFINHIWHGHLSRSLATRHAAMSSHPSSSFSQYHQMNVCSHGMYHSEDLRGGGWWTRREGGMAVRDREVEGGDGEAPWQGQSVETKMTKLVEERGWEVNPSRLCSLLFFFFFFSSLSFSLHPLPVSLLLVLKAFWAPAVIQSAGLLRQSSTWFSMITVIVCAPVHAACRLDVRLMRGRRRGGKCKDLYRLMLPVMMPLYSFLNVRMYSICL